MALIDKCSSCMGAALTRRETIAGLSAQLILVACSGSGRQVYTPPPARPSVFAGVLRSGQTVGILPAPFVLTVGPNAPMGSGEAAGRGAGEGAGGALSSFSGGDPYAGLLVVALLPLAVIIGAIAGAAGARSEEEIEAAATQIKQTFDPLRPEIDIRDRIVHMLEKSGARAYGLEATESEIDLPTYPRQAIDAVLRLEVLGFGLAIERETDPKAVVYAKTRSQVVDIATSDKSAEMSLFHVGNPHDYFDLAKNDTSLLTTEIDHVLQGVASQIVEEVLAAQA